MKQSGIYRIVNTATNRTYFGSSKDVHGRLRNHRQSLAGCRHRNQRLQHSWNKYGKAVFVFEPLLECSQVSLIVREQAFVDAYFNHDMPLFNLRPSSESNAGFTISDESRQRMMESHLGIPLSKDQRRAMSLAAQGKPKSAAAIEKSAEARRGRAVSVHTRAAQSLAKKGVALSAQHRLAIGNALRGRTLSQEHCRKIGLIHRGMVHSVETRHKIGLAGRDRVQSQEHIQKRVSALRLIAAETSRKQSISQKRAWEERRSRMLLAPGMAS